MIIFGIQSNILFMSYEGDRGYIGMLLLQCHVQFGGAGHKTQILTIVKTQK